MRRIIWSPKALQDYANIVDYLQIEWTPKEIQRFVDRVEKALTILSLGKVDFKKVKNKPFRVIVIKKQISIFYRNQEENIVEIIRFWDNRQNPKSLND